MAELNIEKMTQEVAEKAIQELRDSGVIPRIGRWNDIPKYKDIAWQCSECGHFTTLKHNYCPMCGARMIESYESEVEG